MLMKGPKKKGIAIILSKMAKPEDDKMVGPEEGMEDKSIALDSAAEEVLAAIERKDARMLREAIIALVEMADDAKEESESEEMKSE